ncbi:MAG TPA: uracil-DNA glycosylase [Longimicrobium sp.]|jgi:uracil-DNA glycosylase|uniref:uracil-DNA glycosylase n=1 Tax=Longimicrobium sp. TaxID=2029185 RepID=UPI002ED9F61C
MDTALPESWRKHLADELSSEWFAGLRAFVDGERARAAVYPPAGEEFTALRLTPYDKVRVLILGQDPYHGPGQAHGLAFSVRPGVRPPPSLANIFKELRDEMGCAPPGHGSLEHWARQGVLLLNAVLTVRDGEPNSHKGKGWERFTDAVIRAVAAKPEPVVFVLWGGYAAKKEALIGPPHFVHKSAHPSPLSARRGFFGSTPFTIINRELQRAGGTPIDWCIPRG